MDYEIKDYRPYFKKYRGIISGLLLAICLILAGYEIKKIRDLADKQLMEDIKKFKELNPDNEDHVTVSYNQYYLSIFGLINTILYLFVGGMVYARIEKTS